MPNPYRQAAFLFSANCLDQLPTDAEVEVAFVGRSNAGKSSALNALSGQSALARVSKTPGRTRLINYFTLPTAGKYLVDLPGYGYAKVAKNMRLHWEKLLGNYLATREALKGVVLIMDIRHPLKEGDEQLLICCATRGLPVHIVLTKADKLKKNAQNKQRHDVEKALAEFPSPLSLQVFSSLKKQGIETLSKQLDQWIGSGVGRR